MTTTLDHTLADSRTALTTADHVTPWRDAEVMDALAVARRILARYVNGTDLDDSVQDCVIQGMRIATEKAVPLADGVRMAKRQVIDAHYFRTTRAYAEEISYGSATDVADAFDPATGEGSPWRGSGTAIGASSVATDGIAHTSAREVTTSLRGLAGELVRTEDGEAADILAAAVTSPGERLIRADGSLSARPIGEALGMGKLTGRALQRFSARVAESVELARDAYRAAVEVSHTRAIGRDRASYVARVRRVLTPTVAGPITRRRGSFPHDSRASYVIRTRPDGAMWVELEDRFTRVSAETVALVLAYGSTRKYRPTHSDRAADAFAEAMTPRGAVRETSPRNRKGGGSIGSSTVLYRFGNRHAVAAWSGKSDKA